jgi:hypothetical protein
MKTPSHSQVVRLHHFKVKPHPVTSLFRIFMPLWEAPRLLGHLDEPTVRVVDPVGTTIPVPVQFMGSWDVRKSSYHRLFCSLLIASGQSFDRIIKAYTRDRPGDSYIRRGDYRVIRPEDGETMSRSEFSEPWQAGTTLETSIILRARIKTSANMQKCPRCQHVNSGTTAIHNWIEWCVTAVCLWIFTYMWFKTCYYTVGGAPAASKLQNPWN